MSRYWDDKSNDARIWPIIRDILMGAVAILALGMWGCPQYNVWQQGLAGEAELKRAEQNRKIAVQEAEAKRDAAKALASAEIERARGVAEANKIIGEGLRGHEEYLRYLWIMALEHVAAAPNGSTVVYVPTEANLPIMEASRLQKTPEQK
jgi:regulator of protease activity HflC (stomatin/prohibitin superfamily)